MFNNDLNLLDETPNDEENKEENNEIHEIHNHSLKHCLLENNTCSLCLAQNVEEGYDCAGEGKEKCQVVICLKCYYKIISKFKNESKNLVLIENTKNNCVCSECSSENKFYFFDKSNNYRICPKCYL